MVSSFLIIGQYLHLPNLVQIGTFVLFSSMGIGGYWMVALVRCSLKLGSLLKPIKGLSVKTLLQSGLLLIIFQFLWIIPLILGFVGLKLVTITGVFTGVFAFTSNNSS